MDISLISIIAVSFSLGALHALDADHVMAITVLSNTRPGLLRTVQFTIRWAIGHGFVLITLIMLMTLFDVQLSPALQHAAEISVGLLLIGVGLWCFWRLHREQLVLVEHHHDGVRHRHWQKNNEHTLKKHQQQNAAQAHAPVLVGVLHGIAGSASALALIPAMLQGRFIWALTYMGVFSLGVMLSMLVFGLGWGRMQQFLSERYLRVFEWNRRLIAVASVLMGIYWFNQAI